MNKQPLYGGRPFLFKLFFASLILIAITGWLRLYQSIYQWDWLLRYEITPGPLYTAIYGFIIGVAGLLNAIFFWLKVRFVKKFTLINILFVFGWWWFDYLVFSKTALAFTDLPFRLLLTLTYLSFVFGYLIFSKHLTD